MKPFIYVLCLAMATCSKSGSNTREFTIPLHECRSLYNSNSINLCYDSIVTDSRCPVDQNCIWAGIGVARFTLHIEKEKHTLTLAIYDLAPYSKDTTIAGYTFELTDMQPCPGSPPSPAKAIVKLVKN